MVWYLICGVSCLYQSKIEEAKRGGKPAIWPILCCRQYIIVVSTPPSSMSTRRFHVNNNLFLKTKSSFTNCRWTFDSFCSLRGRHFTKWRNTSKNLKSQLIVLGWFAHKDIIGTLRLPLLDVFVGLISYWVQNNFKLIVEYLAYFCQKRYYATF